MRQDNAGGIMPDGLAKQLAHAQMQRVGTAPIHKYIVRDDVFVVQQQDPQLFLLDLLEWVEHLLDEVRRDIIGSAILIGSATSRT